MESILGILISLMVQWLKKSGKLSGNWIIFLCVCLSIISATVYNGLMELGWWETVKSVLTTAGAFYAFIIRPTEKLLEETQPYLEKP